MICCAFCYVHILGDSFATVSTPSQDLLAKDTGSKQESIVAVEEVGGGEQGQELKSPNLRSNQIETKENIGLVSTEMVIFVLS